MKKSFKLKRDENFTHKIRMINLVIKQNDGAAVYNSKKTTKKQQ